MGLYDGFVKIISNLKVLHLFSTLLMENLKIADLVDF